MIQLKKSARRRPNDFMKFGHPMPRRKCEIVRKGFRSLLFGANCALIMASNPAACANVSRECVKAKTDFDETFPLVAKATRVDIRDRKAEGVKEVAWGTLMSIVGDWTDTKAAQRCFDEILKAEGIPAGPGVERLRKELKP